MKARKKPVEVDVWHFNGDHQLWPQPDIWPNWMINYRNAGLSIYSHWDSEGRFCLMIPTLEGLHKATMGDWIIRGVNGEVYPCKPDIFEKTYDLLPDSV